MAATAAFLAAWRGMITERCALVTIALTTPSTRTVHLATRALLTSDGISWEPLVSQFDPIEAPGDFLSRGFDPCSTAFRVHARSRMGWQDPTDTFGAALSQYQWQGASVLCYLWVRGLSVADMLCVFNGQVDAITPRSDYIEFICTQQRASNALVQPTPASRQRWPRLPAESQNVSVPIVLGDGGPLPLRGSVWNTPSAQGKTDQQRVFQLCGGAIPSSKAVTVDNGLVAGAFATNPIVAAACHPLVRLYDALGYSSLSVDANGQPAYLDIPSSNINTIGDATFIYVPDATAFAYAPIPFADLIAVANPARNAGHVRDIANEYEAVRFDYDGLLRLVNAPMSGLGNLGRAIAARFVACYRTKDSDPTDDLHYLQIVPGSGTFTFANGSGPALMKGSVGPTTLDYMFPDNQSAGSAYTAQQGQQWDFGQSQLNAGFTGASAGKYWDLFFAALLIKYRPAKTPVQDKTVAIYRDSHILLARYDGGAKLYKRRSRLRGVTKISVFSAEVYCQPVGHPDGELIDGIDLAQRIAAAVDASYAGKAWAGYGFTVKASFNDQLTYTIAGGSTYTATIGALAYSGYGLAATLQAAVNAQGHGKTFAITYDPLARKITMAIVAGGGTFTIDRSTLARNLAPTLGFQMFASGPPAAASTFTGAFARADATFFITVDGTNVVYKWSAATCTAEGLLGFDAVDDAGGTDTLAVRAVPSPTMLTSNLATLVFTESATTRTVSLGPNAYQFAGADGVIERAPDIASFLLQRYAGIAASQIETGAGAFGSFVDARAALKTWMQGDMRYFRSIDTATEVHVLASELAEQSASWFYRDRFTGKFFWVPWRKSPAVNYALTLKPEHVNGDGHLQAELSNAVGVYTQVRVNFLLDALKGALRSACICGPATSSGGYGFMDMRDEMTVVIYGSNDWIDWTNGSGTNLSARLTPGSYAAMALAQHAATIMNTADSNNSYQVLYDPTVVAGYNDLVDFKVFNGTSFVEGRATIPAAAYGTWEALAAQVTTSVNAALAGMGGVTTRVAFSFSRTTRKFSFAIASGNAYFDLYCRIATGGDSGYLRSTCLLMGYDASTSLHNLGSIGPTVAADSVREENRYILVQMPKTVGNAMGFAVKWSTGTHGAQTLNLEASAHELFGFQSQSDSSGALSYMADVPKGGREALCAAAALAYGSRGELTVDGDWIRDTYTARELRNRLIDLSLAPPLTVSFATQMMPDVERGRVIQFDAGFDRLTAYGRYPSDGSWAGKKFWVTSVRQHMGPDRWDTEVTCVEAV